MQWQGSRVLVAGGASFIRQPMNRAVRVVFCAADVFAGPNVDQYF